MCCCDEDIIALICVGVPMIAYAVLVGFPWRNPSNVGSALTTCSSSSNGKSFLQCVNEKPAGKLFLFIMIVAAICIVYSIVVQILKCVLCCCSCCCCGCCGCLDCFLKYAFRIGVGVGYPSLADFLTYLITSLAAKNNSNGNTSFNNVVGAYSGLSMLSLASGWVFTIVIGSFFIRKDNCCLKFLGLVLGCIVAFVIIAAIVPADPYKIKFTDNGPKWAGVLLGLIDVVVFTAMYAAALCCLGGGCCK
ncbi:Cell division protein kinase 2 [Giardia duodenalis]|uniref:Cell division protein kinase 2 n=1 Tax=Giardia intestinalis TaxID=5741 RepID=V6TR39_GIAIN|nr:Cell division protein kinase 2 [Giardia intestinalis]